MNVRRTGGSGDSDGAATSVFIIAATEVVRAGLASLVADDARFRVVGSGANLRDLAFEETERPPPDVVIVDAERQPEVALGALRAFAEALDEDEGAPAFVVIGVEDGEWVRDALDAGLVRALLPRGVSGVEIVAALGAVSAGLVAVAPETLGALLATTSRTAGGPGAAQTSGERRPLDEAALDALTPREREVLELLAEGLSNKEIAWRMNISGHTVKFHVASIFAKLNVSTRTEAVAQGIRKGLVMM